MKLNIRKIWAEFIGTFFIIFIGCASIIIDHIKRNSLNQIGIAFGFGAAFVVLAFLFYKISGSHFNPAVSFSLFITGKLSVKDTLLYIFSQLGGGLAAGLLLLILFSKNADIGAVSYESGIISSRFEIGLPAFIIIIEFAMTFLLMLVYTFSINKSSSKILLPVLAGIIYFLTFLIFHKIEGAGLNPIRVIIPALYTSKWKMVSYYLIGIFSGSLAGGITGSFLFRK